MMNSSRVFLILFLLLNIFSSSFSYGQEIDAQTQKLASVQKSIKQKQIEKDKLAKDERTFKREVQELDKQINEAEKKIKDIANDIANAQKNLTGASQRYDHATHQKDAISLDISQAVLQYNKMVLVKTYDQEPVEYKIRQKGLEYNQANLNKQVKTANISWQEMDKWEDAKQNLLNLRKKESSLIAQRKSLADAKTKLLKSTSQARQKAETDLKKLQASAKQLQQIIDRLIAESIRKQKQEEERKRQEEAKKKAQASISAAPPAATISPPPAAPPPTISGSSRRTSLDWPVKGVIIENFGRAKHPELDTYVVRNGIKIKAASGAAIKSVENGVVVFRGNISSYGKVIIIEHSNFFSVYGMLTDVSVSIGDRVRRGQNIARLGSGENNVLYFEIRLGDEPDNPMLWLH
ncbi:MAG: peptidoglycan DD-metalloendopeptidase family protein [Elusimicrobiota bacterium]|jgi:septal ring factor EnvC (AmiA/AmiB activator)|nr:peptidoglycan DD-metalloendopeptidase family protein [Elusimicrobiota bacterium]